MVGIKTISRMISNTIVFFICAKPTSYCIHILMKSYLKPIQVEQWLYLLSFEFLFYVFLGFDYHFCVVIHYFIQLIDFLNRIINPRIIVIRTASVNEINNTFFAKQNPIPGSKESDVVVKVHNTGTSKMLTDTIYVVADSRNLAGQIMCSQVIGPEIILSMWLIGVSGVICRLYKVAEATVSIIIAVSREISGVWRWTYGDCYCFKLCGFFVWFRIC